MSASVVVPGGTDPAAAGDVLAWQVPGVGGMILRGGVTDRLPGSEPALGDGLVAWREGDAVRIAPIDTLRTAATLTAPGDELAVSGERVAWRDRDPATGRRRILVTDHRSGGAPQFAYTAPTDDADVGRPALDGSSLAFHLTTPRSSRIVEIDLATGRRREIRAPLGAQLLQPSLLGDGIAYVRAGARRQELVVASRSRGTEAVAWSTTPTARRDAGREPGRHPHRAGYPGRRARAYWPRPRPGYVATLWTTALSDTAVYVTRLRHNRGAATTAEIVRADRPPVRRRRR